MFFVKSFSHLVVAYTSLTIPTLVYSSPSLTGLSIGCEISHLPLWALSPLTSSFLPSPAPVRAHLSSYLATEKCNKPQLAYIFWSNDNPNRHHCISFCGTRGINTSFSYTHLTFYIASYYPHYNVLILANNFITYATSTSGFGLPMRGNFPGALSSLSNDLLNFTFV